MKSRTLPATCAYCSKNFFIASPTGFRVLLIHAPTFEKNFFIGSIIFFTIGPIYLPMCFPKNPPRRLPIAPPIPGNN